MGDRSIKTNEPKKKKKDSKPIGATSMKEPMPEPEVVPKKKKKEV